MSEKPAAVPLQFDGKISTPGKGVIRRFADIPSIRKLQVPEIEYVVPALAIPTKAVTLWCGPDGTGKSYLAQSMAVAVARGEDFLGMPCLQRPVLYLDYENPASTVMDRFHNFLLREDEDLPLLKVWGIWEQQQPPRAGSDLLIEMVREVHPLVIIDTFRSFHDQKENESDGMSCVMAFTRAMGEYGASIVLLHHPSKTEGSNGRGSSVIHASCDVALMHTLNDEGLITLRIEKNRNGANRSLTVRANFEEGIFELTDAPFISQRSEELSKLERIIQQNPGSSQSAITAQSGMMKARVLMLLKEGTGTRWQCQKGARHALLYYPKSVVLEFPEQVRTAQNRSPEIESCSAVLPYRERTARTTDCRTTEFPEQVRTTDSEQVLEKPDGQSLPACPHCGGFAIYREQDGSTSCQTCETKIN